MVPDIFTRDIQKKINYFDEDTLQEIRMRIGHPLIIVNNGGEHVTDYIVTKKDMKETMEYVSDYSLYAHEDEMKQGFLTIDGGHRIGIVGKAIIENQKVRNLRFISSINIRIAHEFKNCAMQILPYLCRNKEFLHTMIISPPGCGKTTLLRDIIRLLSNGTDFVKGQSVGVVDERSEIGACYQGVPQNDLGIRTDLLDGCPKAEGMIMLIRSMSPRVIAVDEIGNEQDMRALRYALHCGCRILATVHGENLEEISQKPEFEELVKGKRFDRYVILSGRKHPGTVEAVLDADGKELYKEE